MDLQLLPPTASQDEIDDELAFVNVLIESLDQGADDYQERLRHYEHARAHCQQLLQPFHANLRQPIQPVLANQSQHQPPDGAEGSSDQPQRDNWWQAATSGRPGSNHSSNSAMSSSPFAPVANQQFPNATNGTKRSRPESLHTTSTDYAMKRPTPGSSNAGTPASSTGSFEMLDSNERARMKQAAAEAAARMENESREADRRLAAALAAEMSQSHSSTFASSSQPARRNFQTTFNSNGGYQQPSPVQPQPSSSRQPHQFQQSPMHRAQPQARMPPPQYQAAAPYIKPESLKPDPGLAPRQTFEQRPQHSTAVVDLTASDSEDDIAEIGPDRFTPNNARQQAVPMRFMPMPGAYPAPPASTGQYVYGNGNGYNNPGFMQQAMNGLNHAVGGLGAQMNQFHNLLRGTSSAQPYDLDDDDDDDLIYSGAHSGYAGNENLYQQRFDQLAAYDPTQSKEEIQALLQNIRPDEDMPAHLRVQTPEDMSVQLHKYQEMGLTWLQKQESGSNMGGILADDMGLGKTIQMLSLMVTRKSEEQRCKTTVIIAPLALMRQWKQEIKDKLKPGRSALTVFTHHGSQKAKDWQELRRYDVVLTTFGSIGIEVKKLEKFRLRQLNDSNARPHSSEKCIFLDPDARWYRVILDEAQVCSVRAA